MNLNISRLREAYKNRQLTPVMVIENILRDSKKYAEHNIWIQQLGMQELQAYIDNLENKNIDELPLYGIPFAIKDNIDLAGVPTTAACAAFAYTPEKSAFVVEQLIAAGAIPVGKTNMDQFATGLVGTRSPEPWGACKNSFNKKYISGGSSSGSAVAVALGLASFALGTDTAGSGRVPAAFNNLVGLKPSKGLLSMTGVVPACRSLDCISIFALTTDDANTVFEQAAVYDANDQYARAICFDNNARHYGLPSGTFTFAIPKDEQLEYFGDAAAQALFEKSVRSMQALGGVKRVIDFGPFVKAAKLLYDGPWVAERYLAIESIINERPDALLPVIKTIIGGGKDKTALDVFRAEYKMQQYRVETECILAEIDFLMTPTAATVYSIEQVNASPVELNSRLGYYTNYMNLLDCAAVAVPAGFIGNNVPWGVSLIGSSMQDRKLLSYANRWQQYNGIKPGCIDEALATSNTSEVTFSDTVSVVVCGAHLDGLAFNWQLRERGATQQEKTLTAATYRMFVVAGDVQRPGLVRDERDGQSVEIEIWKMPKTEFGEFVAAIPPPLGIGKVETSDGRWLPGFICESHALADADEITALGGWRQYLATK